MTPKTIILPLLVLLCFFAKADSVSAVENFAQVSAGNSHTCAVSNSGNAYCWGLQTNGRLGNNEAGAGDITTPIRVLKGEATGGDTDGTYLTNISSISAGSTHTCAFSNSGNAYCWGLQTNGRLGNGEAGAGNITTPIRVQDGIATGSDTDGTNLINISSISAGSSHTCAVSNSGNAYCWGIATIGKLGNGVISGDFTTPIRVQDGIATGSDTDGTNLINIASISAGSNHTCAVSNSGNAYCWGTGTGSVLGNNTASGSFSTPVHVLKGIATGSDTDGTNLINIASISAGNTHTCAVSNAGHAYCWGASTNGKLGNNITTPNQPTPGHVIKGVATSSDTDGTNLINITQFSVSLSHTCAVSNSGNAYCWGLQTNGRLGNNEAGAGDITTPIRVLKGEATGGDTDGTYLTNIAYISSAKIGSHTCAISNSGNAYCWGQATSGKLGNGVTTPDQSTPVHVLKGSAASGDHDDTYLVFAFPESLTFSPLDNSTEVSTTTNLTITFTEDIQASSTGSIFIVETGSSTLYTIPADSSLIDDNTATITLPGPLSYSTAYHILIDPGAFEDLAGNPYQGITTTTAWNFTTEDEPILPDPDPDPEPEPDPAISPAPASSRSSTSVSGRIANLINNGDIAGATILIQQQLVALLQQLIQALVASGVR